MARGVLCVCVCVCSCACVCAFVWKKAGSQTIFLGGGLINPDFVVISEYIKLDTSSSVLKPIFDLVIHLLVILSDIKLNLP